MADDEKKSAASWVTILTALIGALTTITVALINRPSNPPNVDKSKTIPASSAAPTTPKQTLAVEHPDHPEAVPKTPSSDSTNQQSEPKNTTTATEPRGLRERLVSLVDEHVDFRSGPCVLYKQQPNSGDGPLAWMSVPLSDVNLRDTAIDAIDAIDLSLFMPRLPKMLGVNKLKRASPPPGTKYYRVSVVTYHDSINSSCELLAETSW
jgi:hypothetical protein